MIERKPKVIWYSHLGFKHNPFSIKPAIVNDKLIGQAETVDAVQEVVRKGGFSVIVGQYGVGKTTFLKSVFRRFSGRRKVVYFSCNRLVGPLNLDKLLHERFGVVGKLFKIKSKNMILLLDEAENMTSKDFTAVLKYVKEEYFKSVVFVTHDRKLLKMTKTMLRKVGDNIHDVSVLSKDDAIVLVRNRIGDIKLISNATIGKIYGMCSESPRTFLKNCEDVCRHVVDNGHKRVTKRNIREALRRYMDLDL